MKIVFSNKAETDIANAIKYFVKKDVDLADAIFDKVWYTCELLTNMPKIGISINRLVEDSYLDRGKLERESSRESFFEGMRKFSVVDFEKFLIFYRVHNDKLIVVRILHSSRDIPIILAMDNEE